MRAPRGVIVALLGVAVCMGGWASATRVVRAPHVEVLYDDPAMAGYAQKVAGAAERELTRVAAMFGRAPFPIRIRLQSGDDVFNAFALPLPRPHVTFRPLTPLDGEVGFHSGDLTALVLRHEITHLVQLTDTRLPPGDTALPKLGLVGQGTAVLPPAWLLEGIATYVESVGGLGGRLDDARTRALLWTLAADGTMPTLADVSLTSYRAWPGGRARYLLGSSFIAYLVDHHGFDALVRALHQFQAGAYLLPFSDAWQRAVGTDLASEWAAWSREQAAAARARTGLHLPDALTAAADRVGAPAASPDGSMLAWPVSGGVRVADVASGGLTRQRTLATEQGVQDLTWLDASTVVFSAVARSPGRYPSELFSLDITTGRVARLTYDAHAHLPRSDGAGCVLYVRDVVPEGASLRRWCARGPDATVWTAPGGVHVVGLAVSPGGRVALSLYRPGGVDLALLGPEGPVSLTHDAASELGPAWLDEATLLVSSDATGLFQLYRIAVPRTTGSAVARSPTGPPLTSALGGAEDAAVVAGSVIYRTLLGNGAALAGVTEPALPADHATFAPGAASATRSESPVAPPSAVVPRRFPDEPYSPWPSLLPYGWLPTAGRIALRPFGIGLEITALGLDDSARHALDLTVGYDSALRGPLAGGYASIHYGWNLPNRVAAPGPPAVLGFGVRVGLWPHGAYLAPVDETAAGVRAELLVQLPVGPYAGSLAVVAAAVEAPSFAGVRPEASIDAVLDRRAFDTFHAVDGGSRLALRGRWSYGASGPSAGVWGEASWSPTLPGTALTGSLGLRAGYRLLPPVPVSLPSLAAMGSVGTRVEVPLRARVADGLLALERVDLEPTVRVWAGWTPAASTPSAATVGAGADLAVWADTVLDYEAPLRFGVRGGYADGWWLGVGVDVPY